MDCNVLHCFTIQRRHSYSHSSPLLGVNVAVCRADAAWHGSSPEHGNWARLADAILVAASPHEFPALLIVLETAHTGGLHMWLAQVAGSNRTTLTPRAFSISAVVPNVTCVASDWLLNVHIDNQ